MLIFVLFFIVIGNSGASTDHQVYFEDADDLPRVLQGNDEVINIRSTCKHNGNNDLQIINAINDLGAHFQRLVEKQNGVTSTNFVISPLSLASMICELLFSTRGTSQKYLINLLMQTSDDNAHAHSIIHQQVVTLFCELGLVDKKSETMLLKFSSALFIQPDTELVEDYRQNLTQVYHTKILPTDFRNDPIGTWNFINNWARESTNGKITQILPRPLPPSTIGILANALYFKDKWEKPFSIELTAIDKFQISPEESVNVTVLRGYQDVQYGESAQYQCQIIALPYKDSRNTMYVLLPLDNSSYTYNIRSFAKQFDSATIKYLKSTMNLRKVRIILPKINIQNSHSLLKSFKPDDSKVFNFNGVANHNFHVDDLKQQVSISVDEQGTEAAAVTSGIILLSGGAANFFATRPYMFFINNELTGVTLFWGTITNPSVK